MNHLSIRLWRAIKSQPVTTSSGAELRRSSKALPKAKLAPKKVMVTVWWSAVVLSTTVFWILAKPLHLRSMLSKSMRCTKNCSTYSQHWSTERAQFISMAITNHTSHNFWKLNEFGYEGLPHPPYSPDFLPTDYHFFKHLHDVCRENPSITTAGRMLSKCLLNPEIWIFTLHE